MSCGGENTSDGDGVLFEHAPSPLKLEVLGVEDWHARAESPGEHEKVYARTERNYIVRGRAKIFSGGECIDVARGDLITFLPKTRCIWRVETPLELQYHLD